jgi:hypothetical protein
MYLIQVLGDMDPLFVTGYNNTRAELRYTTDRSKGKTFDTEAEAAKWADRYAPGYSVKVVPV